MALVWRFFVSFLIQVYTWCVVVLSPSCVQPFNAFLGERPMGTVGVSVPLLLCLPPLRPLRPLEQAACSTV